MEDGRRISDESLFDFENNRIDVDEGYLGSPTVKKVPLRQYRRRKSISFPAPSSPPTVSSVYYNGTQNCGSPQKKHFRRSSSQLYQPPPPSKSQFRSRHCRSP